MNVIPKVPVVFKGKFPKSFVNDLEGWSFSREKLEKNKGKLLTLDIDFGSVCTLNCPHCFRRNGHLDKIGAKEMSYDEIVWVVREAKKIGLETIKFLGAGEPFESPNFLDFLEELKKMEIKSLIFTKGHVIGDDKLAKKYFGHKGIRNSKQLVNKLKELKVSIFLGFNSFDIDRQDEMVGGVKGYALKRNKALELLAKAGFNKTNPTRLCLAINPVTKDNYDEIFEMYKWARVRNIHTIVTPTMVAGRASDPEFQKKITPSRENLIQLFVKIYKFNIEKDLQTLDELRRDGIASYAGVAPCNQVACGMYVRLDGIILRCPGDDVTIFGNARKEPLEKIWKRSENFRRAGTYNCYCPPKDGKTIPKDFYSEVLKRLEKEFGK